MAVRLFSVLDFFLSADSGLSDLFNLQGTSSVPNFRASSIAWDKTVPPGTKKWLNIHLLWQADSRNPPSLLTTTLLSNADTIPLPVEYFIQKEVHGIPHFQKERAIQDHCISEDNASTDWNFKGGLLRKQWEHPEARENLCLKASKSLPGHHRLLTQQKGVRKNPRTATSKKSSLCLIWRLDRRLLLGCCATKGR